MSGVASAQQRQGVQWTLKECYTVPASQASSQLSMCLHLETSNLDNLPSLLGRVIHLTLAFFLIVPVFNTIIYLALHYLGLSEGSPKHVMLRL